MYHIKKIMINSFDGKGIREIFSRNLRFFRARKKLSQLGLSIKAGLAHNFVNDIENSKKWVSPETISKLAEVLEIEPYELFLTNPLDIPETKKIRTYLDEVNDHFNRVVREIKEVYFPE